MPHMTTRTSSFSQVPSSSPSKKKAGRQKGSRMLDVALPAGGSARRYIPPDQVPLYDLSSSPVRLRASVSLPLNKSSTYGTQPDTSFPLGRPSLRAQQQAAPHARSSTPDSELIAYSPEPSPGPILEPAPRRAAGAGQARTIKRIKLTFAPAGSRPPPSPPAPSSTTIIMGSSSPISATRPPPASQKRPTRLKASRSLSARPMSKASSHKKATPRPPAPLRKTQSAAPSSRRPTAPRPPIARASSPPPPLRPRPRVRPLSRTVPPRPVSPSPQPSDAASDLIIMEEDSPAVSIHTWAPPMSSPSPPAPTSTTGRYRAPYDDESSSSAGSSSSGDDDEPADTFAPPESDGFDVDDDADFDFEKAEKLADDDDMPSSMPLSQPSTARTRGSTAKGRAQKRADLRRQQAMDEDLLRRASRPPALEAQASNGTLGGWAYGMDQMGYAGFEGPGHVLAAHYSAGLDGGSGGDYMGEAYDGGGEYDAVFDADEYSGGGFDFSASFGQDLPPAVDGPQELTLDDLLQAMLPEPAEVNDASPPAVPIDVRAQDLTEELVADLALALDQTAGRVQTAKEREEPPPILPDLERLEGLLAVVHRAAMGLRLADGDSAVKEDVPDVSVALDLVRFWHCTLSSLTLTAKGFNPAALIDRYYVVEGGPSSAESATHADDRLLLEGEEMEYLAGLCMKLLLVTRPGSDTSIPNVHLYRTTTRLTNHRTWLNTLSSVDWPTLIPSVLDCARGILALLQAPSDSPDAPAASPPLAHGDESHAPPAEAEDVEMSTPASPSHELESRPTPTVPPTTPGDDLDFEHNTILLAASSLPDPSLESGGPYGDWTEAPGGGPGGFSALEWGDTVNPDPLTLLDSRKRSLAALDGEDGLNGEKSLASPFVADGSAVFGSFDGLLSDPLLPND